MTTTEIQSLIANKELRDLDLGGQLLEGLDFSGCRLTNVNFKNAMLRHCRFDEAVMDSCDFDHGGKAAEPTLQSVSFKKATMENCRFRYANISWSDFRYARINQALSEHSFAHRRQLEAFPNLRSHNHQDAVEVMRRFYEKHRPSRNSGH